MNTIETNAPLPCEGQECSAADTSAVLTEQELLDRELQATVGRMRAEVRHIKESIPQALDVRLWTRRYPWTSVGLAAGAGFLTAMWIGSRRNPQPLPATEAPPEKRERVVAAAEHSLFGGLFDGVLSALRLLIADCLRTLWVSYLQSGLQLDSDRGDGETANASVPAPKQNAAATAPLRTAAGLGGEN